MRSFILNHASRQLRGNKAVENLIQKSATPILSNTRAISSAQLTINQLPKDEQTTEMLPKEELKFGKTFSPHMLQVAYDKAKGGWQAPEIIPFQDLKIHPAATALHYGEFYHSVCAKRGGDMIYCKLCT